MNLSLKAAYNITDSFKLGIYFIPTVLDHLMAQPFHTIIKVMIPVLA